MSTSMAHLLPPPKTPEFFPKIRSSRILVIEDDPLMIPLLTRAIVLIDPDIVLDWATNVTDARSALINSDYEAIVADFMLEDSESGFSLFNDCRTLQPDARFAMMSALPISLPVGAYGLLSKPFDVTECRSFLEGLLDCEE